MLLFIVSALLVGGWCRLRRLAGIAANRSAGCATDCSAYYRSLSPPHFITDSRTSCAADRSADYRPAFWIVGASRQQQYRSDN